MGATRGGLRLAGADASDDAGVTQGLWTGAVDPVHRSTVDRLKGYAARLIWAVGLDPMAMIACERLGGGGRPAGGGSRRRRRRARRRRVKCAPVPQIARKRHQEGEGKMWRLTRGLKG
jgi:hypothetical protein